MLTFQEAREVAIEVLADVWGGPGTFYAAETGWQDATAYLVSVGAEEWLVDEDEDFAGHGDPTVLVDKRTGAVSLITELENMDRIDRMIPAE